MSDCVGSMTVKEVIEETLLENPKALCVICFQGPGNITVKFSDVPLEILNYGHRILGMVIDDKIKEMSKVTKHLDQK